MKDPLPGAVPVAALSSRERKIRTMRSFAEFTYGARPHPAHPVEMYLEVSNVCQMRCIMCDLFSALAPRRARGSLMDLALVERNTDMLAGLLELHLYGYGEATIHPAFRRLLELASALEVMVDFFTNGMLLSDELVEALVRLRVFRVVVSMSGANPADYENVYVGGSFPRVVEGLARLDACKQAHGSRFPRVTVNSLAFDHHLRTLPEFVRLASRVGVEEVVVNPVLLLPHLPRIAGHTRLLFSDEAAGPVQEACATAAGLGLRLSLPSLPDGSQENPLLAAGEGSDDRVEIRDLKRWLESNPPAPASGGLVDLAYPECPVLDLDGREEVLREELRIGGEPHPFRCMEPFKSTYVKFNGAVKLCCYAAEPTAFLGTIAESSLPEIWQGAPYRVVRSAVLAGLYPRPMCLRCVEHNPLKPRRHGCDGLFRDYVEWYNQGHPEPVDPALSRRLCGDTSEIVANHLDRGSRGCAARSDLGSVDLGPGACSLDTVHGMLAGELRPIPADEPFIHLAGWAVDEPRCTLAEAVFAEVDHQLWRLHYGSERNDVAAHFGEPAYRHCGFSGLIPTRELGPGRHQLRLRVARQDGSGFFSSPPVEVVVALVTDCSPPVPPG